ncbi:MAG: DinB family protein [Phycisphaerales bacterium]|nr:DinB family protein [Phycisphaerales bacterium]
MAFDLARSRQILERTPAVLRALLTDLDDTWITTDYGPKTWSPFDVVGHLVHGEKADWIDRARIILAEGPDRPFDPFDRFAQERDSVGKTIDDLLQELATLRAENLRTLDGFGLTTADLDRPGTHPALGPVTLGQLLATWTAHDLHHIAQICKCMARHHTDAAGPWRAYVSILG